MNVLKRLCACYSKCGQNVGAALAAPTKRQMQVMFMASGVILLFLGTQGSAIAQAYGGSGLEIEVDDDHIAQATKVLLEYLQGPLGALVMVVSGIGAIMSCAFGQYKAALNCLVVAVGSYILESLLRTFFKTESLDNLGF